VLSVRDAESEVSVGVLEGAEGGEAREGGANCGEGFLRTPTLASEYGNEGKEEGKTMRRGRDEDEMENWNKMRLEEIEE
jgi:hypothetical protein